MNSLLLLLFVLLLFGFTPIHDKYDAEIKIREEFRNLENTVQPKQFRRIFRSTPALTDLEDGEMVIVSTDGIKNIMWRDNIDIYSIKGSCVTVLR